MWSRKNVNKKYSINLILMHLLAFFFFVLNIKGYSQEKKCYTDSIFTIHKDEIVLDMKLASEKIENKDLVLIDNKVFSCIYSRSNYSKKNICTKRNKLLAVEKKIFYSSTDGKIEYVTFRSYSKYNDSYIQGAKLFKEYDFDKQGNIVKEIDTDKGYTICWQEAIEICKKLVGKRELQKYNIKDFALRRADLNDRPNDTPLWIVKPIARNSDGTDYENNLEDKYFKHNKGDLYYYIDGITGKAKKKIMRWTLSTDDQL